VKILFVYPEFPDTFWSFKHALKFIRKKAASPPLSLLTVAAMVPAGWEKRLVDLNVDKLTDQDLAWADYVFISAMVVQRESTHAAVARCKAAGARIVAGGPLFTAEYREFPEVDHFVLNEAELVMPGFVEDLAAGTARRIYNCPDYPDIRQTPIPLWNLADLRRYDAMNIQFSRGCPYNCDFCNITALFGHKPRTKSASQIVAELDGLYALGWRKNIFFVDDNFIGNKRLLKTEILPALIAWRKGKIGVAFSTEVSINLADDPELLRLMTEAGFTTVFIGIETPSEASLSECSKIQNKNRDLVASVKRIQHAGMQVQGGFIVGFDSDTPSIFQQQVNFIQMSGIVTAMVGLLQAPYGTQLYDRMQAEGRLVDVPSGDNVDGNTNIVPQMGIDALRSGYRWLLDQIYAPKPYYDRVRTFLSEYKLPEVRPYLEFQYILAFFRSIYQLGVKGIERRQYWRLLGWTLFRKPKAFPLAVTLAIYGHHFRQVCERHVLAPGRVTGPGAAL
ncbi:MAG TPA: DUF4070 domain-containing protein, partial [Anaerolineae bacterium]